MIKAFGDPMVFLTRPISATVLAITLIVFILMILPSVRKKRDEVFVDEE
jgi:putative tricarboxylic transport membrane protein